MIIETIVTTVSQRGTVNIAPMGPVVDPQLETFTLRPYEGSTTFANLRSGSSVTVNIVDDCFLLVAAAIGKVTIDEYPVEPIVLPAAQQGIHASSVAADGRLSDPSATYYPLRSACHWYALQPGEMTGEAPRFELPCTVLSRKQQRPFLGWNRASHAILEIAIMATRIHLTGVQPVIEEMNRLQTAVQKTAGPRQQSAWQLLAEYVNERP